MYLTFHVNYFGDQMYICLVIKSTFSLYCTYILAIYHLLCIVLLAIKKELIRRNVKNRKGRAYGEIFFFDEQNKRKDGGA